MKRLTSDKPVAEMGMFELAHNSCYIKQDTGITVWTRTQGC